MSAPIDDDKFGGVAVGSVEAIQTAVGHVSRASRVVVVVSAMNGITDLLIDAGKAALVGDRAAAEKAARTFQQRHASFLPGLFRAAKTSRELGGLVEESATQMRAMTDSIAVLHEFTTRAHDSLAARGERLLARIFTAFARQQGLDAV